MNWGIFGKYDRIMSLAFKHLIYGAVELSEVRNPFEN